MSTLKYKRDFRLLTDREKAVVVERGLAAGLEADDLDYLQYVTMRPITFAISTSSERIIARVDIPAGFVCDGLSLPQPFRVLDRNVDWWLLHDYLYATHAVLPVVAGEPAVAVRVKRHVADNVMNSLAELGPRIAPGFFRESWANAHRLWTAGVTRLEPVGAGFNEAPLLIGRLSSIDEDDAEEWMVAVGQHPPRSRL